MEKKEKELKKSWENQINPVEQPAVSAEDIYLFAFNRHELSSYNTAKQTEQK